MSYKAVFRLFKETFTGWLAAKAPLLAAALAYYMVFSLAPLLVIAIAIAGIAFGDDAAAGTVFEQVRDIVGDETARVIENAISNASRPDLSSAASTISLLVLLFAASGIFAQLQGALNQIWNIKPKPVQGLRGALEFALKRLLSFGMVLLMGLFLLAFLFLSTVLTALSNLDLNALPIELPAEVIQQFERIWRFNFIWKFLSFSLSFTTVTAFFAAIYKLLPDAKVAWKDVTIGAIITSALFGLGKSLLAIYLGSGTLGSTYGAAGSLVVLLAWIYYSAQILFLGAEFTQVYARHYGSRIISRESRLPIGAPEPEGDRSV